MHTEFDEKKQLEAKHKKRALLIRHIIFALAVMALMIVIVYVFDIPNPNIVLLTGVTVFTALYGYGPGIAGALMMMIYSMYFFSTDHSFFQYTPLNGYKIAVILVGAVLNVGIIGNLKRRHTAEHEKLEEMNRVLSMDNTVLAEASTMDALTGLLNRFAFRRAYPQYEKQALHVMMLDLDNFKQANDTYGHAVGDYVLREIGGSLKEIFGAPCCYRYGGDEFLVVCAEQDNEEFIGKIQRFKRSIHEIYLDKQHLPIHFSAGFVYGVCELSSDLRLMIHHADNNLYKAKGMGKDRFIGTEFSRTAMEKLELEMGINRTRLNDY